jgi:hypothetical protein
VTESTHIHISIDGDWSFPDLKRLAQAAVHFEPAIEALVPPSRRRNSWCKRNWADNWDLGHKGGANLDSAQSIEKIGRCETENELIDLMCPGPEERYWAWNFSALKRYRSVEFRQGDASTDMKETEGWVELVLRFVLAAIRVSDSTHMQSISADLAGLEDFLQQIDDNRIGPGQCDEATLQWLFEEPEGED